MNPVVKPECAAEKRAFADVARAKLSEGTIPMQKLLAMIRRHDMIISRTRTDRGLGRVDRLGPAPKTRRGLEREAAIELLAGVQQEQLRRRLERAINATLSA